MDGPDVGVPRNEAVVEAMRNVSLSDTPERRAMLYQLLLESVLLAATPRHEAPIEWVAEAGDTLELVTLTDDDGITLPLFTSEEALLRWIPGGSGYAALPTAALFEMAATNGTAKIALDPGSETWGWITRPEIEALARRRLPVGHDHSGVSSEVVAESTEVRIGQPAEPPTPEVLAAVVAAVGAEPRIDEAFVFLMQQGSSEPEMAVGLWPAAGLDHADADDAVQQVVLAAVDREPSCRSLIFMRIEAELRASLVGGSGIPVVTR